MIVGSSPTLGTIFRNLDQIDKTKMNKLNELYDRTKLLIDNRKVNAEKNVNEVLSIIFAEIPSLKEIRVRGWTPGFNDGEPCDHSQDTAIGDYDPWGLLSEEDDEDASPAVNAEGKNDINDSSHPEHSNYKKAHMIVENLCDDFEVLYQTNFKLSITRIENGFSIQVDDYDCGY